jgi:hypothetical protein
LVTSHRRRSGACRTVGILTLLLVAALSGPGHGLQRPAPAVGEGHSGGPAARLHLTVHQGQLSVDLWEAEVGDVLTRIGHEARVIITGSPTTGVRVSAQLTDVELEAGLRRLLGRGALSYAIRYARDSTGAMAMHEVRVFPATPEGPLPPPPGTTRDPEARAATSADPRGKAGSRWPAYPAE